MKRNILRLFAFLRKKAAVPRGTGTGSFLYRHRLKRSETLTVKVAVVMVIIFAALPVAHVRAAAYLTLSAFSGTPTTVQVSGGGWTPGETISIYLGSVGGSPAATTTVGGDSFWGPTLVIIPASTPQGSLPIIGVGSSSGSQAENGYYVVQFTPALNASPSPNSPGSVNLVSGSGYAPGETVLFSLNGMSGGSTVANSSGSFTDASFTVPSASPGTYQLHGTGASSGADAIFYFYVGGFYPSAYPSTYYLLPGQSLSFSGSGWAVGETITVTEASTSSPLTTFVADGSGGFTNAGAFPIPFGFLNTTRTFHLAGAVSHGAVDVSSTVGQFYPGIFPSAYYVSPSDPLSFSGSGFAGNEQVNVYEGVSPTVLSSFVTGADGSFTDAGSFLVPFTFAGGTRAFRLVGQLSGAVGETTVTVGQYYPSISPSDYYIRPGQIMTVSGSGFAAGETVDVAADGVAPVPAVANGSGAFSGAAITVPFTSASTLTLTGTGRSSHATASVIVTLGSYFPTVTPSVYYAFPGDAVSFQLGDFAPGENIQITSGAESVGSVTANASGSASTSAVTIPFGSTGSKTYTFTGASSNGVASIAISLGALFPYADADTYYITPGSTIHVKGYNFGQNEGITITGGVSPVHTTTDAAGNAGPAAVVVPFGASPAIITLTGDNSGVSAMIPITLAPFYPTVTPSTWYTSPGASVTFSGSGFAAGETVAVRLNGSNVGSAMATAMGTIATSGITIPVSTVGPAHFTFTGAISGASAGVDIGLAGFSPLVSPSTWYASPGAPVTFSGSGFASGENVAITRNGISVGSVAVNGSGEFTTGAFNLPFGVSSVQFGFNSSLTGASQQITIGIASLSPSVVLSNYYDVGGVPITITGYGFGGGESVALAFGSASLGNVTTDVSGNFTFNGNVPFGTPGNVTVTALGASSAASGSASFTRAEVFVNAQLGAYAGAPGEPITFIGSGYLPNEPIEIKTDRTGDTVVHSFTADASGNFNNAGFMAPAPGGSLTLRIIGTHSVTTKVITYWVTGP